MIIQNRPTERQENRRENQKHEEQQRKQRRNPRIVCGDPDSFFRDLLMEQQEQS